MVLVKGKNNLVLPSNYCLDEDGIWKIKTLKSGQKKIYIGKPFNILGVYFTENKGYGILIEWTSLDNNVHKHYINNSDFLKRSWINPIVYEGYLMDRKRINDLRDFLCDIIFENNRTLIA